MLRQVSLLTILILPAMVVAGGDNYFTGDGTSYTLGKVSSGNCNFMYDPGVGDNYAALNSEQWDSTRNCGRCAQVSCDDSRCSDTTSSVTVYLMDQCPECRHGDLDLSPTVFKQLTGSTPSRYRIKWTFVDCPVRGNIKYCTKSGSSSSWLAVQPANFADGVASMKIANQEVTMIDSCYYFLLHGGVNVDISAVDIELTSISGETVTDTVSLAADSCTVGTSNFGSSNSPIQSASAPAPITFTPPPAPPVPVTPVNNPTTPTPAAPSPVTPVNTPTTPTPLTKLVTDPSTTPTPIPASPTVPSAPYNFTSGNPHFQTQQREQEQSEVNDYFDPLKTDTPGTDTPGTDSDKKHFTAGKVIAANETEQQVKVLQSDESGVEKALCAQQQDETDCTKQTADSDIEHVNTTSEASVSGTSPVIVGLTVLAVVGVMVVAVVFYVVQKKKLDDKRIDQDLAMMRSFDTFSSPVRFEKTIAKI